MNELDNLIDEFTSSGGMVSAPQKMVNFAYNNVMPLSYNDFQKLEKYAEAVVAKAQKKGIAVETVDKPGMLRIKFTYEEFDLMYRKQSFSGRVTVEGIPVVETILAKMQDFIYQRLKKETFNFYINKKKTKPKKMAF